MTLLKELHSISANTVAFISRHRESCLFTLLFIVYGVVGLFGFGTDSDTYLMLRAGQKALMKGVYHYSRPPGYLIPEVIIGAASLIGGHLLTNAISTCLAVASLYLARRMLNKIFSDAEALLIISVIGLNPHFVIAASSAMDYVYSLFFILCAVNLLRLHRHNLAAVLFALAVSSRLSNVLIVICIYLYLMYIRYRGGTEKELWPLVRSAVFAAGLTVVLFIPSFIAADNSLGFMTYYIGDWSFLGHLSRFVYKNIYMAGPGLCLLLASLAIWRLVDKRYKFVATAETITGIAIIVIHELLFFKVPLEPSYLLPLLFVAIPLVVILLKPRRLAMYAMLVLTLSHSFIANPDCLDRKYNKANNEAVAAKIGLYIRPGIVVADMLGRDKFKKVNSKKNFI